MLLNKSYVFKSFLYISNHFISSLTVFSCSKSIELDGLVLSVHKCAPEKIAMQLSNGKLVL